MYTTNSYATQQPNYLNYQQYRPVQSVIQQPYTGLKGRPVASIEEARASIIDFDGSIFFFPDLANKRIYTKQINMDGTALLSVYELKEIPIEPELTPQAYVTREEFETVINQLRQVSPISTPSEPVKNNSTVSPIQLNF